MYAKKRKFHILASAALLSVVTLLATSLLGVSEAQAQRRLDEAAYTEAIQRLNSEDAEVRIAAVDAIGRGGWRFRRQAAPHLRRLIRNAARACAAAT